MKYKTRPLELPAQIFPAWAIIPNLHLDPHAEALITELAATLEAQGCTPIEARAFVVSLFSCFCQDGTVHGIALHPRQEPIGTQPGQKRVVSPAHLAPRHHFHKPILSIVAERLVQEFYRAQRQQPSPTVLDIMEILARKIDVLAQEPSWCKILTVPPDYQRNRVFELHYELTGYPMFDAFVAELHGGLIARIREVESQPAEIQTQLLRATLTAPRALIPVIPETWVQTALTLDAQELRAMLETASKRLQNIEPSTRLEYVNELTGLISGNTRAHANRLAVRPIRIAADTEDDFDDSVEAHSDFDDVLEQHDSVIDKENGLRIDDVTDLTRTDSSELQGLDQKRAWQQARWIASRKTFEANVSVSSVAVMPLHEIALGYASILQKPMEGIASKLNRAMQFTLFDLLIHTGRPVEWLVAIEIGTHSSELSEYSSPILDIGAGAVFYVPQTYPTIPPRLQPPKAPDTDSVARWQADLTSHMAAHEVVDFVYQLPLSPTQLALLQRLLEIRARAIQRLTSVDKMLSLHAGALFLVAKEERIREWKPEDTPTFLHGISEHIARVHRGWSKRRSFHFAKTFEGYYVARHGLNPVLATYISGQVPKHLECPVHYVRVNTGPLCAHYTIAQSAFRSEIEREYAHVQRPSNSMSLPWSNLELVARNHDIPSAFGSWRCPQIEPVRTILQALTKMTFAGNESHAHNAQITLLAVMLQVTVGARPYEIVQVLRTAIDFSRMELTVGQVGRYHKRARQVPLAQALLRLAHQVLNRTAHRARCAQRTLLLWFCENNELIPATQASLESMWREAGLNAGLSPFQIPTLYSLRHLYCSRALAVGIPNPVVRAVMGHQSAGIELYNPDLQQDANSIMRQASAFADRMAEEVGFDASQF